MNEKKIEKLIYELLKALGENPERDGLKKTPERVAKMYTEVCKGLNKAPENLVSIFKENKSLNSTVEINNIPVCSICEHHLLPFTGRASIKYAPKNGKIMGLSKFARIVDYFARKPQVQERLTSEIANFLFEKLEPKGIEVILECEHTCMTTRGIKAHGSTTKTTTTLGNFQ